MAQTRDNERPTTPAGGASAEVASHRSLLPYAWPLFTAVWLVFSAGFIIRVLNTDPSPLQLLALLVSMAAFVAVFVWLMLRYPFPASGLTLRGLRGRIGLLLVLAALALCVEALYGSGVPHRFMYVVVAAAVTLPTRHAAWMVGAVTVFTGTVYVVRSGWDAAAASWGNLVPFALIGVGMIAVSRLVVTIRELDEARREIAQLAVAEERLRFARDLHDLLGHSLSSITLKSELAGRLLSVAPEKAASEVRDIEGVARRSLREVREAVAGYRQPTLGGELDSAREVLEAAGIAFRIENKAAIPTNGTATVLAWAMREGVTNVIRHSRARNCGIQISEEGDHVHATISDDGLGHPPDHDGIVKGSGLVGLSERVSELGGDFEAGPPPEGGFRLRVSLPLQEDTPAEPASKARESRKP